MRGRSLLAALLVMVAGTAMVFAVDYDFGLSIDSATTYGVRPSTTSESWEQRLKTAVWLSVDFGPRLTLDGQLSYLYTSEPLHLVDLDFLTLSGLHPLAGEGVLGYTLGRQRLADPTGSVLNHAADGLTVSWGTPRLSAAASVAYTGLLLKPEANLSLSAADAADKGDDSLRFAPRRLIVQGQLGFPEVFARQTPLVFFLAQFDLRQDAGARVHTQYSGVTLSGPLAPSLYYDGSLVLATGRDEAAGENLLGLLAAGGARYFNPRLLFSRAELRGLYASGASGSLDAFLPISAPTLAMVFSPALADLIAVEGSYSLKPFSGIRSAALESVQLLGKGALFWRAADTAYRGAALEGALNLRPFSDLGAALKGGVWLPQAADPEYAFTLEVSLAL